MWLEFLQSFFGMRRGTPAASAPWREVLTWGLQKVEPDGDPAQTLFARIEGLSGDRLLALDQALRRADWGDQGEKATLADEIGLIPKPKE